jgi:aminomethyltransferase
VRGGDLAGGDLYPLSKRGARLAADSLPLDRCAKTPLFALHEALGARLVPFAGYAMPVQYKPGILKEHLHVRSLDSAAGAGLFDVSHMGQARLSGRDVAGALEALVPGDMRALKPGRQRYTLFTNEGGGVIDDLMATALTGGRFALVINASRKDVDLAHLRARLGSDVTIEVLEEQALLALQGPQAGAVLQALVPAVAPLRFMDALETKLDGIMLTITRSGYTGEDGFEISVPGDRAVWFAERLLADARVAPIGLGARDSLRLEAGLCLYGNDLDEGVSPIEAGLAWTISKRRRAEGGFPGAARIQNELAHGPARCRVGLAVEGRQPARPPAAIRAGDGETIGAVTSGGFGPSVDRPVAMGYVAAAYAAPGTRVDLLVRDKKLPATIVALPFAPHRYALKSAI